VRDKKTTFEIKNLNCEESLPGWVLFDDRSFPQYRKVSVVPQPPPFFLCVCFGSLAELALILSIVIILSCPFRHCGVPYLAYTKEDMDTCSCVR
jgi:hypothetical protein